LKACPGEFSQHDFREVDVEYLDGTEQRVRFFASRLKYSRAMQVSLVPDQAVESLLRSLATHLATWGGAPLVCIFDRPKTVALKWGRDGVVTEWNATFAYAALELGIGVDVCWPYRAQEKGSVENLVGFVKGSFFKQRRFHDVEDLHQQLGEWLLEVNELRPRQVRKLGRGRIFYKWACRTLSRRLLPRAPRPAPRANDPQARTP
jgi:transposase